MAVDSSVSLGRGIFAGGNTAIVANPDGGVNRHDTSENAKPVTEYTLLGVVGKA